jgi:cytochrome b561
MVVLPVSGWVMISAAATRRPFSWYGVFPLPYINIRDKAVGAFAHESHEVLGYAMIALLVLHVAAALKHHFLDRSRLIARMWPERAASR